MNVHVWNWLCELFDVLLLCIDCTRDAFFAFVGPRSMFITFSTSIVVGSLDVENAENVLYSSVRYYSKYLYELAGTIKLLHDFMFFYRSY